MMRIKPSTFGGLGRRRTTSSEEKKEWEASGEQGEKAGKTERWSSADGIIHVSCSALFRSLHVLVPLDKLSPSASGSWPGRAHALPPWGWCSFPPLGLALLFLRSAFMWLEATWPLAPPPGSILSGLNPWTKKGTPGPLILLLFWAHFWWRKWD